MHPRPSPVTPLVTRHRTWAGSAGFHQLLQIFGYSLIPRGSGALLYCGFPTECGGTYLNPVGPTKSQNNKIWEPTPTGSRFAGFQISAPRALKSFTKGDPIPKRIPFPISFFERTIRLKSGKFVETTDISEVDLCLNGYVDPPPGGGGVDFQIPGLKRFGEKKNRT